LVEFSDILPIFYVLIPCVCLVAFYKIRTSLTIEKTRQKTRAIKQKQTIEGTLDELIDTAPEKLRLIDSELASIHEKCLKENIPFEKEKELTSRLNQERSFLELAAKYGDIAKPIIKPISKIASKFIGNLGQ
jgi:hypothetical protein